MGFHPHQYFVYGVAVLDEERANEIDDDGDIDLFAFCEENGVDFEFGGNASSSSCSTGLVVGFTLPVTDNKHDTGDYGAYAVTPFDLAKVAAWMNDVRSKMTPQLVAKVRELLGDTTEPALYTISNYG